MSNTYIIDGALLAKMFVGGTANLKKHKEVVNSLNVFPVPDGDTGTNMTLTMTAATKELSAISGDAETISKIVSKGSLMGARGNSGVILSQIFRGFANGLKGKEEVNLKDFCNALKHAKTSAYSAVLKPVEGTILTVIKDIAESCKNAHKRKISFEELFEEIIQVGEESLANTPNLLPVLQKAGVVDSGGQGLVYFLVGMQKALIGDKIILDAEEPQQDLHSHAQLDFDPANIKFTYCTEFILRVDREPEKSFRERVQSMGDSLVFVRDDELLKIHVHTNHPGEVLEMGLRHGDLVTIKIENMKQQHSKIVDDAEKGVSANSDSMGLQNENRETQSPIPRQAEEIECAFVAVGSGHGIKNILEDLGVDHVIEGGQTMNPSTSDFLEAIGNLNAKNIILFPNNSNIILAAEQASSVAGDHVHVLPTKTLPECITAIISYDNGCNIETNLENMTESIKEVKTISVTHSIRNTEMDGHQIKEGDYIAVHGKGIVSAGRHISDVAMQAVESCVDDETELITVYTGLDAKDIAIDQFKKDLEEKYEDIEVSFYSGGQAVYYFIISVE